MKYGCLIYFFLNSANLICRGTDISKYFRESLGLRDNGSRLYINKIVVSFCFLLLWQQDDKEKRKEKQSSSASPGFLYNKSKISPAIAQYQQTQDNYDCGYSAVFIFSIQGTTLYHISKFKRLNLLDEWQTVQRLIWIFIVRSGMPVWILKINMVIFSNKSPHDILSHNILLLEKKKAIKKIEDIKKNTTANFRSSTSIGFHKAIITQIKQFKPKNNIFHQWKETRRYLVIPNGSCTRIERSNLEKLQL